MSAPHRDSPFSSIPVPLLAASIQVHRGELEEQAALHDAWRETFVWFAVVVVLILGLIVVRQRRKPVALLGGLFRSRRIADMKAWRRGRVERRRVRVAAERAVENERLRVATAAPHVPMPPRVEMGPPTLGFGGRFVLALLTSGIVTVLVFARLFGTSTEGWGGMGWLLLGGPALIANILGSFCFGIIQSLHRRHNLGTSIAAGALSAVMAIQLMSALSFKLGLVASEAALVYVAGGAVMGLIVGAADEASRKPIGAPAVEEPNSVPLTGSGP